MRKRRANLSYILMQSSLWGIYAVFMSFASNYLIGHGFDGNRISLVLGVSSALSIALQLLAAELVSRRPALPLHRLMLLAGVLMLAGCAVMLFSGSSTGAVGGFFLTSVLLQILPAMVNSLGMDAIRCGAPVNFGLARGFGSLCYSLVSYAAGMLVARRGFPVIPGFTAAVVAVFLLSVLLFHRFVREPLPGTDPRGQVPAALPGGFLRRNRRFALFLAGSILLNINNNLICNFMLQIMQAKGAGAGEQGVANALSALLELPAIFAFSALLRRARCGAWVRLSSVFFVLKALAMFLAPTAGWVYAAQLFQTVGYALYSISSVFYARAVIGPEETVRAQSYLSATSTIGSLVGLSAGGVLCQAFGAQFMLLTAAAAALLGAVILLFAVGETERYRAIS